MARPRSPNSSARRDAPLLGPLEEVPIELLRPYAKNARTHGERQLALIEQSIATFGFNNPIIAEADGTIIAGHGRWEAAKRLGLRTVSVLRARHLTPEKVRAYRLADNRLAELGGWDEEMLVIELGTLDAVELDFSIETIGWSHAEIDVMIDPPAATTPATSDGPPLDPVDHDIPSRPDALTSRRGDVWRMGEHRLLAGSSLEPADLATVMNGERASMVFHDGPYNVPINGHVSGLGKVKHREFAMASGEMSPAEFQRFNATNLKAIIPHVIDGAILALCIDWRGQLALLQALGEVGLDLVNLAVWVKSNGGMGSLYRSQHELVLIAKHGKAAHINNVQLGKFKRYRTNVWRYPGVNSFGRGRMNQLEAHPTPKPVALVADAIRDVSHRGQIVLDTFMGSGTTLLAAERTGRVAYGIDIDSGYVDVTIARWQAMTKRDAIPEETGETFGQVQERRQSDVTSSKVS